MWCKSIFLATLVALGLLAVPSVNYAQVTNLVPNPSFEEDEVILNDAAWDRWCTWGDGAGLASTLEIDETEFIDGMRSLRVEPKGNTNWYFIVLTSGIPLKVGTTYTTSIWAKAQAPRPLTVQLKATDNSVSWGADFQLTNEWAEYSFTGASQNATVKLEILCAASEIPFWVDFVNVYEGEYVPGVTPSGAGPQPKAAYLEPKNGVVIDQKWVKFAWKAGDSAVSHRLYVSETLEALDGGQVQPISTTDTSVEIGRQAPYATPLTPGTTYYWRVDEINDQDPNSPWKGDVWSFRVRPVTAWNPMPGDAFKYVGVDQDLTWEYGLGNMFHTVYFGESFEAVSTATAGGSATQTATYDPETLKIGTTYYWRVDEFAPATGYRKGDVWSFTTVPDVVVTDPDLLGWWTLDEGMGVTAVDWSGHGNHGRIVGSAEWTHGVHDGALYLADGANVEIPALNVTTNTVTMTAWVKRDGSQSDWAAVLFKRQGGASGMGFGPANELRYHWTDKYWDFTTGIVPPDQEWFFMAFVVEPTQATLYFNGTDTFARNQAAHDPFAFDGTLILGRDPQGGRDLKATVDDVRFYNKALNEAQIKAAMRGDLSLAWNPAPAVDAVLDVRDATSLSWSAGDGAASHDVYFGADRETVTEADRNSPEFRGNQVGANFSLAGLVDMDSGDCFWRIDEVQGDGTVRRGYVWQFTVLPYLLVDDFESYTNEAFKEIWATWLDGTEYGTKDPTNGSMVGADPLAGDYNAAPGRAGGQCLPIWYDNTVAPKSEALRTFQPADDWTVAGVAALLIHFRGAADNTGTLYVKISGKKIAYTGPATDIASAKWTAWPIDLASAGVTLTNITTLAVGVEGGGKGTFYVDDIRLIKP